MDFNNKIDIIIAYPPFYSKKKDKVQVYRIWQQFFGHAKKILNKKMVVICQKEDIRQFFNSFNIIEERKINIGNTTYYISVLSV